MPDEEGYVVPSADQMQNRSEFAPLKPEEYIVKIAKIWLEKTPSYNEMTRGWNWNDLNWSYRMILLPVGLRSGSTMRDKSGNEVKPLTMWLFRDINPFSMGVFNSKVSFMRQVAAYSQGIENAEGQIKVPGFILLDSNKNLVKRGDPLYEEFRTNPMQVRAKGYEEIWDLTKLAGKFIGCSVELTSKDRNKVTRFTLVPENFTAPVQDAEDIEKFEKKFAEFRQKQKERTETALQQLQNQVAATTDPVATEYASDVVSDELDVESIPF